MLGVFMVKMQNWEGKSAFLTEDQLSRIEMWCAADNYNNICHICAEELLDSNCNKAVNEIVPNFTYSQKL